MESTAEKLPYAPGNRVVDIIRRIHDGKTGNGPLTVGLLRSMSVPEGNADRVQKALQFLGLLDDEFNQTQLASKLRKANNDEYPAELAQIIQSAYSKVFDICDPGTASGSDLNNAFHRYEPAGQREIMIGLFMALCREAGLAPPALAKRGRGAPLASKGHEPPKKSPSPIVQRQRDGKPPDRLPEGEAKVKIPSSYHPILSNLLQAVPEIETEIELSEWWELFRSAFTFVKAREKKADESKAAA